MANVQSALWSAVHQLEAVGLESPRVAAEWTLAHVLGCARLAVVSSPNRLLTPEQEDAFQGLCRRLAAHEPMQYVLGGTEFMGLFLKTDARALIPRPETEQLVERVLGHASFWNRSAPGCGVDVGTGSGCIVLALATRHPEWWWTAVEREPDAMALARENARALGLEAEIAWRLGDLLEGMGEASQDMVVSNPPYIPRAVCETLAPAVRDGEPRTALDGGEDGLDALRRLIGQAARVLRPGGWIFLEIGHDQGHGVRALLEQAGFRSVSVHADWAGRDRIAEGMKP